MHNAQSWSEVVRQHWADRHRTALPMSPRSRDLADINFLQQQHRRKMKDLMEEESQGFDFCLILQPQEVYAFWADLLDFRTELLGEELTRAVEDHWEKTLREKETPFFANQDDKENVQTSPSLSPSTNTSEARDCATELKTPRYPTSAGLLRHPSKRWHSSSSPDHKASPSLYSLADSKTVLSTAPSVARPPSMFERALGPMVSEESFAEEGLPSDSTVQATPGSIAYGGANNNTLIRRKWGSQNPLQAMNRPGLMSPPVRVLAPSLQQKPVSNQLPPNAEQSHPAETSTDSRVEKKNPHEITLEEIPNKKVPRGIAARTKGLSEFLPALRRGIVLRKHRPGHEASFCKIVSTDGGDTIQVHALTPSQAYPLLREQRRLYNVPSKSTPSAASDWSLEPEDDGRTPSNRNMAVRHFTRVVRRGVFRIADVVAVHPARREDPRSMAGNKGTLTLRRSHSNYCQDLSFSLVLRSAFARSSVGNNPTSIEEFEIRWGTGDGNESQF